MLLIYRNLRGATFVFTDLEQGPHQHPMTEAPGTLPLCFESRDQTILMHTCVKFKLCVRVCCSDLMGC